MQVLNKRVHGIPAGAIYVGRPSKWGNPFSIGKDGDRAEVIRKYRNYICENAELRKQIGELTNHDLVCWCAPEACHADILLELAESAT